ncbi:hypothetical protein N8D56_08510 [Devosia sp. A8/3-2]|nr:hypothetical protein N8D56_08510 [Devosia sp. A8/3-2]
MEGIYASPSLTEAAGLMKEAADAELAEAQYDYGTMLIEGAGSAPNEAEGAKYIKLAAEQDLIAAQIDYATLLYLGRGVEQNIEEAATGINAPPRRAMPWPRTAMPSCWRWAKACRSASENAAMWRAPARRRGLSDPSLDRLLISIPNDQLAKAEERARFWPSIPPTAETIATIPTTTPAPQDGPLVLPAPTDPDEAPTAPAEQTSDPAPQPQNP